MDCNCKYCKSLPIEEGLLHGNIPMRQSDPQINSWGSIILSAVIGLIVWVLVFWVFWAGTAHAYTLDQYANAIRQAECNSNYGILQHYKHTTYRQACKNTVWHTWLKYKKSRQTEPFTAYLGGIYCPFGVNNDPTGLTRNWIANVQYFLEKG